MSLKVQWRLWTLMAVVAVAALLSVLGLNWRSRAERFRTIATGHAKLEAFHADMMKYDEAHIRRRRHELGRARGGERFGEESDRVLASAAHAMEMDRESFAYHAQMRMKYERAASHPWLSVSPDPPEPPPIHQPSALTAGNGAIRKLPSALMKRGGGRY